MPCTTSRRQSDAVAPPVLYPVETHSSQSALLEEVEAVGLQEIVHDNAMGFWIGVRSPCDNGTASIAIGIMLSKLYVYLC